MTFGVQVTAYDPGYPGEYSQEKQNSVREALAAFAKDLRQRGFSVSGAGASGGGWSVYLKAEEIGGPLERDNGTPGKDLMTADAEE